MVVNEYKVQGIRQAYVRSAWEERQGDGPEPRSRPGQFRAEHRRCGRVGVDVDEGGEQGAPGGA